MQTRRQKGELFISIFDELNGPKVKTTTLQFCNQKVFKDGF
jgi:hypothetical protein